MTIIFITNFEPSLVVGIILFMLVNYQPYLFCLHEKYM